MHLGLSELLNFYRDHADDDALVLGTVVATEGSTYRKPGAMMLIAKDGTHCGLISGGCLESDLALQAARVFDDGEARNVCYDLSSGDELVWGLGIGCDGVIHLLLQRLQRGDGFGFLATLQRARQARRKGMLALVIASTDPACPPGSHALDCGGAYTSGDAGLLAQSPPDDQEHDMSRRFWKQAIAGEGGDIDVLYLPLRPPPTLLICGAGIDAVPVARLGVEMGWDCIVVDHRSGFARAERFPQSCSVRLLQPDELSRQVDLGAVDAVIMMTHNLAHDRQYLSQVIATEMAYIGLLGPRARRDRLLDEVGFDKQQSGRHIHGPAGLDIGAELPSSIALAIVAEIHARLNLRDGGELTPPER